MLPVIYHLTFLVTVNIMLRSGSIILNSTWTPRSFTTAGVAGPIGLSGIAVLDPAWNLRLAFSSVTSRTIVASRFDLLTLSFSCRKSGTQGVAVPIPHMFVGKQCDLFREGLL